MDLYGQKFPEKNIPPPKKKKQKAWHFPLFLTFLVFEKKKLNLFENYTHISVIFGPDDFFRGRFLLGVGEGAYPHQ